MQKKLKFYQKILLCLVILPLFPGLALADGMIIHPDPNANRHDYVDENDQQAFINYEQGLQKMILSISLEKQEDQNLVWIFPVPGDPQKVVIDVIDQLPNFRGQDISKTAKNNLKNINSGLANTQIYPAIIKALFFRRTYVPSYRAIDDLGLGMSAGMAPSAEIEQDVVIYEHLEKEGITSEILTAKTASGLDEYFKSKNLKITSASIPVLTEYLGKDYTFIASWLTSPIKPSSETTPPDIDLGQANVPAQKFEARILMNDYVIKPYNYPEISQLTSEFMGTNPDLAAGVLNAQNQNTSNRSYELIFYNTIRTMPTLWNEFSQKLESNAELVKKFQALVAPVKKITMPQTPPISPRLQKLQKGLFVTFPTSKIYFPLKPTSVYGSKEIPITIRVIGLVNPKLFDLIKSYAKITYFDNNYTSISYTDSLTTFYGIKKDDENIYTNTDFKNRTYTRIDINVPSKYLTEDLWINPNMPVKTILPLLISRYQFITTIIFLVILSFLLSAFWGWLIFNRQKFLKFGLWGLFNILSILGLIIATLFLKTKPIRPEDADLFAQLKNRGYSMPNYQYRDIRKLYYLGAFTLSFTVIAWALTKLLGLIL